jgi:hypothetical protein
VGVVGQHPGAEPVAERDRGFRDHAGREIGGEVAGRDAVGDDRGH